MNTVYGMIYIILLSTAIPLALISRWSWSIFLRMWLDAEKLKVSRNQLLWNCGKRDSIHKPSQTRWVLGSVVSPKWLDWIQPPTCPPPSSYFTHCLLPAPVALNPDIIFWSPLLPSTRFAAGHIGFYEQVRMLACWCLNHQRPFILVKRRKALLKATSEVEGPRMPYLPSRCSRLCKEQKEEGIQDCTHIQASFIVPGLGSVPLLLAEVKPGSGLEPNICRFSRVKW